MNKTVIKTETTREITEIDGVKVIKETTTVHEIRYIPDTGTALPKDDACNDGNADPATHDEQSDDTSQADAPASPSENAQDCNEKSVQKDESSDAASSTHPDEAPESRENRDSTPADNTQTSPENKKLTSNRILIICSIILVLLIASYIISIIIYPDVHNFLGPEQPISGSDTIQIIRPEYYEAENRYKTINIIKGMLAVSAALCTLFQTRKYKLAQKLLEQNTPAISNIHRFQLKESILVLSCLGCFCLQIPVDIINNSETVAIVLLFLYLPDMIYSLIANISYTKSYRSVIELRNQKKTSANINTSKPETSSHDKFEKQLKILLITKQAAIGITILLCLLLPIIVIVLYMMGPHM